ncbi:tRNA pseudouridine synthase A [plant metagenome]|uniref:tRNA pseudouridine synthase A n=1 Tax=plant metagenome TaxID=1297885 RepID=A0A484QQ26_9ZZZZ
MEKVRISKLMSERGLCSRREADGYIERGWVKVDGVVVSELGARAFPSQAITLERGAQAQQAARMTVLLHKPVGYVSGQAEDGYEPAVVLVTPQNQWRGGAAGPAFDRAHLRGLAPAGRLDIDSTGLLVLTQNGAVARTLIGEDSDVDKEYLVRVQGKLGADGLALLNHGLTLDGRALRPAQVSWQNDDQLRFVLREGRKRQIRRMCELVGLKVIGLKRVRIGNVVLGDLPVGQWRYLRPDEKFDGPVAARPAPRPRAPAFSPPAAPFKREGAGRPAARTAPRRPVAGVRRGPAKD